MWVAKRSMSKLHSRLGTHLENRESDNSAVFAPVTHSCSSVYRSSTMDTKKKQQMIKEMIQLVRVATTGRQSVSQQTKNST